MNLCTFQVINTITNNTHICSGVACLTPFLDATEREFDLSFGVNVKAMLNVSQVVARNLIERKLGGSIVNVSSQTSMAAIKDHAIYASTKGAVDMLTK